MVSPVGLFRKEKPRTHTPASMNKYNNSQRFLPRPAFSARINETAGFAGEPVSGQIVEAGRRGGAFIRSCFGDDINLMEEVTLCCCAYGDSHQYESLHRRWINRCAIPCAILHQRSSGQPFRTQYQRRQHALLPVAIPRLCASVPPARGDQQYWE